jgi:hypothetical protein
MDGAKKTGQHMESTSTFYQTIVQILYDTFNCPEQAASKIFSGVIKKEQQMKINDLVI